MLTQVKPKSRDELSGHHIIYPTRDEHIFDILCTLNVLSVSKCNIHFSKQHRVY